MLKHMWLGIFLLINIFAGNLAISCVQNESQNFIVRSGCELTDNQLGDVINYVITHPSVSEVDLSNNQITDQGVLLLAQQLPQVYFFDLHTNRITDKGVQYLTDYSKAGRLDLSYNQLTDNSAYYLLKHASSLRSIDVSYNQKITYEGMVALAQILKLKELNATGINLSHSGKPLLGNTANKNTQLLYIDFSDTHLSPEDAQQIMGKKILDLKNNSLGEDAASAIIRNHNEKVYLGRNNLTGEKIADAFLEVDATGSFISLDLGENDISDEAAAKMLATSRCQQGCYLDFHMNYRVGDAAAIAVANNSVTTSNRILHFDFDSITNTGAFALANSRIPINLLSVINNKIGNEGLQALKQSSQIYTLYE